MWALLNEPASGGYLPGDGQIRGRVVKNCVAIGWQPDEERAACSMRDDHPLPRIMDRVAK